MAIFNDNNGPIVTSGNYCAVEPMPPPLVASPAGGDCEVIVQLGWTIVSSVGAAGTINRQTKGADGIYRTVVTAPFPITIAPSTTVQGTIPVVSHGEQLAVVLTGGSLTYAELVALIEEL